MSPVLVKVVKFVLPLLVERQSQTDGRVVNGGARAVAEPPDPPAHLLGHHDQLRQGEAAVQVGLGPGQEEPGQVGAQLVGQVSSLQDNSSEADMTDVPWEGIVQIFITERIAIKRD